MSLADRIIKASTSKNTALIRDSKVFGKKTAIPTDVPMINVALSSVFNGGLMPGILTLAGPSKHFKTTFGLLMAASFQKRFPEGIVVFIDTEFGSPEEYFQGMDVDLDRVIHIPVMNIEELKFEMANLLDELKKEDDVFFLFDSLGNIASKKESDDAKDKKSVADMTRAKQIKSLFRIITPHLSMKDLYMVVINHTYDTQEMYSKKVVSGGTGIVYSSNDIWIIGRQQDKDQSTKQLMGYDFIINIEKSRTVREGAKIPISVRFEGGIRKYSGVFEHALAFGYIEKINQQSFHLIDPVTGEVDERKWKRKDIENNVEFLDSLVRNVDFEEKVSKMYKLQPVNGVAEGAEPDDEEIVESVLDEDQ